MRFAVLSSHPVQYYAPLFRELARHVDLHVFYSHDVSAAEQSLAGFGVEFNWDVNLLDGYSSSFLVNVSKSPTVGEFGGCDTPGIRAHISRRQFDVVLTLGWHLKSLVQGIYAAKRAGIPVLVRGDSQLLTSRSVAKLMTKAVAYPFLLRVFDAALYVGSRSRAYYEHYRYPPERLFFSPHCVDVEWFRERGTAEQGAALRRRLGISPDAKVVLFAGKLLPFKRPVDVVEACGILITKGVDVRVLIAGSGRLECAVRERAAAMGVPLHCLGFQNQTEIPAAYAAADLLMLPSTGRETWGLVANESLACGTPIAVSNAVGCAPDLAADELVGRVFRVGDVDSISNSIMSIFTNPPKRRDVFKRANAYSTSAAVSGIVDAGRYSLRRRGLRSPAA